MYHEVQNIVCFQIFYKTKKMICVENIGFLGVLQKIYLLPQFHRQNKIDDCISFTKPWSRASQAAFLKKFKNKIYKNIFTFFSKILCFHAYFLMFCIFFNRNRWKTKNYTCGGLEHSIPHKMMFVSTIQVKNCGRRQISNRKSVTFRTRENHIKT